MPSIDPPPLPVPSAAATPSTARPGTMIKLLIVGALTVGLMIPLMLIYGVLNERVGRRDEAVRNITASWGENQTLTGPVLIVPYRYTVERKEKVVVNAALGTTELRPVKETLTARAYFLPERLAIEGALDTQVRSYGIYEAVLFRGAMTVRGVFTPPSFEDWKVAPDEVLWDDAIVAFHVSDLRGAPEALTLDWNGAPLPLEPGARLPGFSGGVFARLRGARPDAEPVPFSMDLALNGSSSIRFTPAGRQTTVRLASAWPDPKFEGAFLPAERTVDAKGFAADWAVSYYGRTFPQQWTDREGGDSPFLPHTISDAQFGVSLLSPVDQYRLVERSIKYGLLFIVLVFTAFFLFEILGGVRVHPFQYTLVGAAIVLFFLLLLALSEVRSFAAAYAAGAAACTGLITAYAATALRSARRAGVVAVELAAIYGMLYVILKQQDYALLLGAAGLFVALALVMFATRRLDWYGRDGGGR